MSLNKTIVTATDSAKEKTWVFVTLFIVVIIAIIFALAAILRVVVFEFHDLKMQETRIRELETRLNHLNETYTVFEENVTEFVNESMIFQNKSLGGFFKLNRLSSDDSALTRNLVNPRGETTWKIADGKCATDGKRLCTADEIMGKDRRGPPAVGWVDGEHYAPVSDRRMDWIDFGRKPGEEVVNRRLTFYEANGKTPEWSEKLENIAHKTYFYCCIDLLPRD